MPKIRYLDADDFDHGKLNPFGWITPHGDFVETQAFNHVKMLVTAMPSIWMAAKKKLRDIERDCRATGTEWHIYDMALSDFNSRVVRAAYEAGAIRVGSWNGEVHFEGTRDGLSKQCSFCKQFAADHDMSYVFEPIV